MTVVALLQVGCGTDGALIEERVEIFESVQRDPTAPIPVPSDWQVLIRASDASQAPLAPGFQFPDPVVARFTAFALYSMDIVDTVEPFVSEPNEGGRFQDDLQQANESVRAIKPLQRLTLEVGIAVDHREKVRIRIAAEQNQLAEIRMDGRFEFALLPIHDAGGALAFVGAMYQYDGHGYAPVSEPVLSSPARGTTLLEFAARSGTRFDCYIKVID